MGPNNGRTDMIIHWLERIEGKVDCLCEEVSALKVKAGLYGGAAAIVVSAIVVALFKTLFK